MSREVVVELRKYPDAPGRVATTTFLGEDEFGTWLTAGRLIYLVPNEGWWKARHFPDGGWKVDIATPAEWQGDNRVVLHDLALDVRRYHWQVWVEDRHEFEAAARSGRYPPDVVRAATRACDDLAGRMHDEPFRSRGDRWLGMTPSQWDSAILLDMGGVLQRRSRGAARQAWEARLGLDDGAIDRAFAKAIGPGWEGRRSPEEMSWIARAELGLDHAKLWQLRVDLMADHELDGELLRRLAGRPSATAAAIVSNNGADVRAVWEAAFDINALVDLAVVSGEERVAKPDPTIFEIACGRLGVAPDRCLFVDDQPVHVEAARELGMTAVVHSPDEPAYEAIERHLAGN